MARKNDAENLGCTCFGGLVLWAMAVVVLTAPLANAFDLSKSGQDKLFYIAFFGLPVLVAVLLMALGARRQ